MSGISLGGGGVGKRVFWGFEGPEQQSKHKLLTSSEHGMCERGWRMGGAMLAEETTQSIEGSGEDLTFGLWLSSRQSKLILYPSCQLLLRLLYVHL